MRTQLGAMLKSDLAIDLPARAQLRGGSFRNFVSRTISVLDVEGGPISIRKGSSPTSDVHVLQLRRGSVQLDHADGRTVLKAGQFVAFRGSHALQFRHQQDVELLAV